jgi:5'-nucleotidase
MNRRYFLRQSILSTSGVLLGGKLMAAVEHDENAVVEKITILHTNDVHSRLEPFPMDGSRNQGLGGIAQRATVINNVRKQEANVLLLDAGDIFQGTPYFNIYKGEPEIKAMSMLGYDASTIGNHDFDAGLQNFANQLQHATFAIVNCNYNFTGSSMEHKAKPYIVIKKGKIKIGITGVGIELKGLVPDSLTEGITYNDPVASLEKTTAIMKQQEGCDLIVCLSHLGYKYDDNKISDVLLAQQTTNIDIVIGGHTHTFMKTPEVYKNKQGFDVIVNQVGFAGIQLGRLDLEFLKNKRKNLVKSNNIIIEQKSSA